MSLDVSPDTPIVLLGFMGSGKSSVARILASILGAPLIDLDARIVEEAGRSIAAIFSQDGEEVFRALETAQLSRALHERGVIATGGGIVTREENRVLLQDASTRGALVVYLRASPQVLAARIRRQPGRRPLIDGDGILDMAQTRARVEELLQPRALHYESCANLVLDCDTLSVSQLAHLLARHTR